MVQASQSVVQVFIQYRVNFEGFLAIRGASQEHSPIQYSGNWGLKGAYHQLGRTFTITAQMRTRSGEHV